MIQAKIKSFGAEIFRFIPRNRKYYEISKLRQNNKDRNITVLFLVQTPNVWNAVDSIFNSLVAHKNVKVFLIALPPLSGPKLLTDEVYQNYSFCKTKYPNGAIESYDKENKCYFDLNLLKPDFIFVDKPYSDYYPSDYSLANLSKIAPVCYVPYGYNLTEWNMHRFEFDENALRYFSYIFVDNEGTYRYCKKKIFLSEYMSHKRLYEFGYPKFDLYNEIQPQQHSKIVISWLPRWTTDNQVSSGNEPSSFFEYKDDILKFAERWKDKIELIIRPHPKAFENYIRSGCMTKEEVNEFIFKIKSSSNICLDSSSDYLNTLMRTDILIADFSSLVAEFFLLDKPIVYLGPSTFFPKCHRQMYSSFYTPKCWKQMEQILNDLLSEKDILSEKRKEALASFCENNDGKAGQRIAEFLINLRKG